jgi:hypothetical protein
LASAGWVKSSWAPFADDFAQALDGSGMIWSSSTACTQAGLYTWLKVKETVLLSTTFTAVRLSGNWPGV